MIQYQSVRLINLVHRTTQPECIITRSDMPLLCCGHESVSG